MLHLKFVLGQIKLRGAKRRVKKFFVQGEILLEVSAYFKTSMWFSRACLDA